MRKLSAVKYRKLSGGEFGAFVSWEKKGQSIEGILVSSRKFTQEGKERIAYIVKTGNETVQIGESAVLAVLRGVPKGTQIKVVFKGVKKGKKYKYNDFDVFIPEGVKVKGPGTPF